jgi:hypothetical protein
MVDGPAEEIEVRRIDPMNIMMTSANYAFWREHHEVYF